MPVIVTRKISLLRAPRTGRPFRTGFCAKSAFPGAVVIRNDTATPRRRSRNSRRPVSTCFRPERAKEDTAGEAQLFYSCRRAFPRASGTVRTFAVSVRIFVARFLRGCSVLNSLTPAVGFLSAWRVRFRSRHLGS